MKKWVTAFFLNRPLFALVKDRQRGGNMIKYNPIIVLSGAVYVNISYYPVSQLFPYLIMKAVIITELSYLMSCVGAPLVLQWSIIKTFKRLSVESWELWVKARQGLCRRESIGETPSLFLPHPSYPSYPSSPCRPALSLPSQGLLGEFFSQSYLANCMMRTKESKCTYWF